MTRESPRGVRAPLYPVEDGFAVAALGFASCRAPNRVGGQALRGDDNCGRE